MKTYETLELAERDGYLTREQVNKYLPSILKRIQAGDNVSAFLTSTNARGLSRLMVRLDGVQRGTEIATWLKYELVRIDGLRTVRILYSLRDILNALERYLDAREAEGVKVRERFVSFPSTKEAKKAGYLTPAEASEALTNGSNKYWDHIYRRVATVYVDRPKGAGRYAGIPFEVRAISWNNGNVLTKLVGKVFPYAVCLPNGRVSYRIFVDDLTRALVNHYGANRSGYNLPPDVPLDVDKAGESNHV